MDSKRDEESVSDWLGRNDEFARSFVDEYIHSHPLFLKELMQKEMDKRQQQMLLPIPGTSGITLPQLSPSHSTSAVRHATVGSTSNIAAAACKTRRKSTQQLRALSKQDLLMELLKDVVTPHFDVNSMSHKILVDVLILTNADRSSLFLVEGSSETPILVSRLFDVTENSTLESVTHDESEAIKIPFGSGIVGKVAKTGLPIVLEDAYQDNRFNPKVDTLTGYHTKAIMCLPIKTANNTVLGVAQVINKKGGGRDSFSQEDQEVFRTYLAFCAIGLVNVQLLDQSFALSQQLQILLHLARGLFEEATSLPKMIKRIMSQAQELIPCRKALVLLLQKPMNEGEISFNQAFELESSCNKDNDNDEIKIINPSEVEGLEVALEVARTKKFFSSSSAVYGIQFQEKASSMLCMPIFDAKEAEIGVVIIKDKLNGLPFNSMEVEAFRVFGTFCGLGVQNVLNYEEIFKANAKQSVALEVLSFHATASDDDTLKLLQRGEQVTTESAGLYKFEFDDLALSDDETVLASVRMFIDLGLVSRHHIDLMCLYRWVLTVKKNYRPVTYHNWRHAFNVAQCMYSMITSGAMAARLSDLEQLGLLIACLCHDLDHRGTNNAFQAKTDSPLAQLYTTSTMEHHHFDHCIMILNSQGNRILSNMSTEDYEMVIRLLENAILSTDLALYFKKKGQFTDLVKKEEFQWNDSSHRDMLRGMMMTACDVAAITKPWPIQQRVAELVASEFFEQGDKERHDLHLEPIAMMDRRKKDELPKMQVGFIDSICLSLYDSLRMLEPKLTPLHDGCRANRGNWQSLADTKTGPPLTTLVTPPTPTSLMSTNTPTLVTGTSTQSLNNGSSQLTEEVVACDKGNSNEQPVKTSNQHRKKCTIS